MTCDTQPGKGESQLSMARRWPVFDRAGGERRTTRGLVQERSHRPLLMAPGGRCHCPLCSKAETEAGRVSDSSTVHRHTGLRRLLRQTQLTPCCPPLPWVRKGLLVASISAGAEHPAGSISPAPCPPSPSLLLLSPPPPPSSPSLLPPSLRRQDTQLLILASRQPPALAFTHKYLSSELINTERRPADKTRLEQNLPPQVLLGVATCPAAQRSVCVCVGGGSVVDKRGR